MTEDIKYKEARKRVKRKKDFYEHLTTYIIISVFLVALNMITSPGRYWFHWPVLGWGMAVLFNYLDVFGVPGIGPMDKEWEDKAIQEEMDKMDREDRPNSNKALPSPKKPKERLELPQLEKRKNWDEGDLV